MKKRKICIFTGTRAEYGLLKPLIDELKLESSVELQLIISGMHLSPEFGLTYKEIDLDGFSAIEKVEILLSSDTPIGVSKAIGLRLIKSSLQRKRIVEMLSEIGFLFPTIVSPNSIINEDVIIGNGTVVMDGVVINSGTSISEFSIINTNSSIDHDCKIGSFSHIAPGVTLSGEITIGDNVLVGTGANVIQQIKIPDNTIISSGSSVQKNVIKAGIYRGVPAVFVKTVAK